MSYCRKTINLVFKRITMNLKYFVEEANFSKAFVISSVTKRGGGKEQEKEFTPVLSRRYLYKIPE